MSPTRLAPALLIRPSLVAADERAAMARHFDLVTDCQVGLRDALVCARYAAVPLYDYALERGLAMQGSRLVHDRAAHAYIASFAYYHDLGELTPKTWFALAEVPQDGGPYVVKGATNSRKYQWKTHMFAPTFRDVVRVAGELATDSYLCAQSIIVREYVPLVTLEVGINDLPFANEWRVFYYRGQRLTTGYYWSEAEARGTLPPAGLAVADEAARRLAPHTTFVAIDVAERADGRWTVIEVNDGQMAGLSCTDPDTFYAALRAAMERDAAGR